MLSPNIVRVITLPIIPGDGHMNSSNSKGIGVKLLDSHNTMFSLSFPTLTSSVTDDSVDF